MYLTEPLPWSLYSELFRLDTCDDEPLLSYVGRASVEMLGMPDPTVWSKLGDSTPPFWKRESHYNMMLNLKGSSILQRLVKMVYLVKIVRSVY